MLVERVGESLITSEGLLKMPNGLPKETFLEQDTTLGLVRLLCETLKARGITYCHWKSNQAIDRSASGENDLDLLVSRADVQQFGEVLALLDFKEAYLRPDKQIPGVLDYYGYDRDSGKLVHLHAHYQLIIGDDATKNYILPVERAYLASATSSGLFPLPSIEFELIIFVIRMMLKHSTWDSILSFQGKLAKTEKNEFKYLTERVDQAEMQKLLQQHLPFISQALFDQCLQALAPNCPLMFRIRAGQALQSNLAAHGRRTQLVDTVLKTWRRGTWGMQHYIFRRKTRKRIAAGGAIIAIVGADGSGKSTVVGELSSWLSKTFYTKKIHLGKPKRSWLSLVVKGIAKVGKVLGVVPSNQSSTNSSVDDKPRRFPGYFWMVWHVLTANDRYRTYIKARRFATNGGIVISDRYPLPQVQSMDGARTGWLANSHTERPWVNSLRQREQNYYQQIMPPEVLIVLRVNPEVAAQRRMDEDADSARRRAQEICDIDWQQTSAHVIDANQQQAEVLAAIKELVWSKL